MVTPFQKRVYTKLLEVPRGMVTTYRDLAHAIGSRGYRAVGTALNKNPFAPRVPCHRVVNSDGSIGGFASGCAEKIAILKKEGIEVAGSKIVDYKEKIHVFRGSSATVRNER